ncbi:unnamed protein product [Ranitomeya imitator]|uniref:Uncharacterized protein n=1 Tax=Ranitomeya imitator TaxID=111125 RepID=A0ABN9KTX0_9NEOB|nr:unnamed protein product [Ranitomeya imitator]
MKVGAIPTHDAYAASWKDRVPADRHVNSLCGFRSVLHLFLNRNPQVKSAQKTLEIRGKSAGVNHEYVLYGLFNCPTLHQNKICWCIINCAKSALWKVRNILLFKRDFISINDCIRIIFSEMYIYYLKDIKDVGRQEANKRWNFYMWNTILY